MSGHLAVVGLGPGDANWRTPEADAGLARAEALYGYGPYLDRVPARGGQARHRSGNREEGERAGAARDEVDDPDAGHEKSGRDEKPHRAEGAACRRPRR